ncbi:hypothetical protein FHX52_1052 [Humibacillus xanthopallidus]|uniref:Uncharacterized protein n=1 Tax=Humibacillus xanthopallidus TaxID=412689 RepID=A0A543PV28_9MICO|nr:hypothetical protein [Humibacillus xanthopallidus]TQN47933.1 hypothetical protein FHX52_1052 [Humibacillus xanthopallidus]
MSTADTPVEDLDLPSHWSSSARDAFHNVLEERPALAGAEFAALVEAANLITTADALDEVARAADYMSLGASGQPVLHPAVSAATAARTSAAQIFARLVVNGPKTATSASQRAQRAATARHTRARQR